MNAAFVVSFMQLAAGNNPVPPRTAEAQIVAEVAQADRDRASEIARLMQIAATGFGAENDVPATVAVRKLGLMRASEAVPLLVKHIDFSPAHVRNSGKRARTVSESLPCVFALGQIGGPAFESVFKHVEGNDSEDAARRAALVLMQSLTRDEAQALIRVRMDKEGANVLRLEKLGKWAEKREPWGKHDY